MEPASLAFDFSIIFIVTAIVATVALHLRLPILVGYILVGAALGPHGISWVTDPDLLSEIAEFGIIFLLFLLGLDMRPEKISKLLGQTTLVGIVSCGTLFLVGSLAAMAFRFGWSEVWVVGASMMFSSTIVGIKLLPTTVLHHKHAGELMVSVLLFQDFIAILLLTVFDRLGAGVELTDLVLTVVAIPLLIVACFLFVRYVLLFLLTRFDAFHEYVFLVAIGWCLGVTELSNWLGMSPEIGAFIAGIALAIHPISQYIAESLKPVRDFFLILFFFALGAQFDLSLLTKIWLPCLVLSAIALFLKPWLFATLLHRVGENRRESKEIGWRLAQNSEFSLLIVYLCLGSGLIGNDVGHVIQAVAVLSFVVSTYIVTHRYTSPLAVDPKLRRD